jgi:hypothetical protein
MVRTSFAEKKQKKRKWKKRKRKQKKEKAEEVEEKIRIKQYVSLCSKGRHN